MRSLRTRVLAVFFAGIALGTAPPARAAIPPAERQVLQNLYTATNGARWTNSSGWNGAAGTECTWFGITCDATASHVTKVTLATNQLSGTIPDFRALTQLQVFSAYDNQLTGSIPPLNGLGALTELGVSGNQLTGAIPSLSSLTSLQFFAVFNNKLTGTIPSLAGLTNLYNFSISGNQLSGPIPPLTGLTALKNVYANGNQLSGSIPSLAGLNALQIFKVSDNLLAGSIPTLSGLSGLQIFSAFNNQLTGTIPSLTGLTALTEFGVSGNRLTGPIPDLSTLSALGFFAVFNNQLSGTVPSLTGLTNLYNFSVTNNQLTGSLPSLAGLAKMRNFYADTNKFTGTIPDISGLAQLEIFYAFDNQLVGAFPAISRLTALKEIGVSGNKLIGPIPDLSALKALSFFAAFNNQLSGSIPSLAGLTNLYNFSVTGNQLSGTIPSLAGLAALKNFYAARNQLTGAIPSLTGLNALQTFSVGNNQLSGAIPALAGLGQLQVFSVYDNQLTGTIPSLAGLTALNELGVSGNRLTGSLPDLGPVRSLAFFAAFNNQLTGTIPSLSGLTHLYNFSVTGNRLTGSLPSLSGLTALQNFYAGNNQLTGSIPSLSGLGALVIFSVPNNQLSGSRPSLSGLVLLQVFSVFGNQLSGAIPAPPSPTALLAQSSRLCPNALQHVDNSQWDSATGIMPWWRDCVSGGPVVVAGSLEAKSLQSIQSSITTASYEWAIDGDGVVGRSGASKTLDVTYPTSFNRTVSLTTTNSSGVRTTTSVPLKIDAPSVTVTVVAAPREVCGDGDGVPQAGERFEIPVVFTNVGPVALRSGFAMFAASDRLAAASGGQGIDGRLVVDPTIVNLGTLEANGVPPTNTAQIAGTLATTTTAPGSGVVTVTLAGDAQCGASYGVQFKGVVDDASFSVGSENPIATLTVPSGSACRPYTTKSCSVAQEKALATPRQGLYLNSSRPGNGLSNFIIPGSNGSQTYFGAWFTGGPDRSPTWYIIQGPMIANTAVGPIYKFTRDVAAPTFTVHSTVVGQAVVAMKSSERIAVAYQMGNSGGVELMDYFVGGDSPAQNQTGAYYNPAEAGWGQVVHQYMISGQSYTFAVNYIYDSSGQPRWTLAQGPTAQMVNPTAEQTFKVHCPGCAWIADWNQYAINTGTGSEVFVDRTHAVLTTAISLPAPYGGTWNRDHLPISLLTVPQ